MTLCPSPAFTVRGLERSRVARLPAAARVEHGPVELDTFGRHGYHLRRHLAAVRVLAENLLGHGFLVMMAPVRRAN
jgi:hypothetical protein